MLNGWVPKLQVPPRVFCGCLTEQCSRLPASFLTPPLLGMHLQPALRQLGDSWRSRLHVPGRALRPSASRRMEELQHLQFMLDCVGSMEPRAAAGTGCGGGRYGAQHKPPPPPPPPPAHLSQLLLLPVLTLTAMPWAAAGRGL